MWVSCVSQIWVPGPFLPSLSCASSRWEMIRWSVHWSFYLSQARVKDRLWVSLPAKGIQECRLHRQGQQRTGQIPVFRVSTHSGAGPHVPWLGGSWVSVGDFQLQHTEAHPDNSTKPWDKIEIDTLPLHVAQTLERSQSWLSGGQASSCSLAYLHCRKITRPTKQPWILVLLTELSLSRMTTSLRAAAHFCDYFKTSAITYAWLLCRRCWNQWVNSGEWTQ